ncbi:hypothetical protein B0H13DRAFT_1867216 [Mycena leptocephala]|nr:hypothetical protein B0H13DRAFT_1867216 [Mycena leptocephala]
MALVSPLAPLPAGILDRTLKGTFGPEDLHPREGTVLNCSGNISCDYFERTIIDPQPRNRQQTRLESRSPYVSDQQVRDMLTHYGEGPRHEDKTSSDESEDLDGWHVTPLLAPIPTHPLSDGNILQSVVPNLKEFAVSGHMCNIGPTPSGEHVLQFPVMHTLSMPVLERIFDDDNEEFEAALAAAWMLSPNVQTDPSSVLNKDVQDLVEYVPNFQMPSAGIHQNSEVAEATNNCVNEGTGAEGGEVEEEAPPPDLQIWNRIVDPVALEDGTTYSQATKAVPMIGSGHHSVTVADYLNATEDIINNVIYLEHLIDRDAMVVEEHGGLQWPEPVSVGNKVSPGMQINGGNVGKNLNQLQRIGSACRLGWDCNQSQAAGGVACNQLVTGSEPFKVSQGPSWL